MSFTNASLHIHATVNDAVIIQRSLPFGPQFFVSLHIRIMFC